MTESHDPPPLRSPSQQAVPSRRRLLRWLTLALGSLATAALGIPIIGFLLGPLLQRETDEWIDLGEVDGFPLDQTRFVDFRNPRRPPWDGVTAKVAAYVRRENTGVKVFSVHCTHLGCPVSWFPGSGLFMCPCHGGVYYKDGQHAAGPPPRGLFRFQHKIEDGRLLILAGHLPTLQEPLS